MKGIGLLIAATVPTLLFGFILCGESWNIKGPNPVFSYNISNGVGGGGATKIIKTELTDDQNKYKHLVGLVQNSGDSPISGIDIYANLMDSNRRSLSNFSNQPEKNTLNPKEASPFDILIFDKGLNGKIKSYAYTTKFSPTGHKENKIEIVSENANRDSSGFYFINGKIRNNSTKSFSNNTTVSAITFDKSNKILGLWKAQAEPYDIPPGSMASFTIPVTDKTQAQKISNYSLYTNY